MAEINTRADSILRYLTGAGSDGGTQTDPDSSLGDFRSSTRIITNIITVTSPITGISVDFASSDNGIGAGTLTVTGSDDLTWTPPGGSAGAVVTIADGETKMLEGGGGDIEKYIIITRSTASGLTGTATVTLAAKFNSVYDDKSSAETTAGDIDYRCIAIKNESISQVLNTKVYIGQLGTPAGSETTQLSPGGAGTITTTSSFADWPAQGFVAVMDFTDVREVAYYSSRTDTVLTVPSTGRALLGTFADEGDVSDGILSVPGISLAIDDPTSQPSGSFVLAADEDTPPVGPTFSNIYTNAMGLDVGTLGAGEIYGIHIRRENPEAAISDPQVQQSIIVDYDAA